jgi:plastocyanin
MKKFTLSSLLLLVGLAGYSTTWTITNSGFAFTPATLTIQSGDDVNFDIASIHQVAEVSESTWNANGNTPLPGGFSTPFGGGSIPASLLTVGTHWYVCVPHASGGMKGIIIVENTTGTKDIVTPSAISIYPNPTTGKIQIMRNGDRVTTSYHLEVFNLQGQKIYSSIDQASNEINLSPFGKGIYFVRFRNEFGISYNRVIVQ